MNAVNLSLASIFLEPRTRLTSSPRTRYVRDGSKRYRQASPRLQKDGGEGPHHFVHRYPTSSRSSGSQAASAALTLDVSSTPPMYVVLCATSWAAHLRLDCQNFLRVSRPKRAFKMHFSTSAVYAASPRSSGSQAASAQSKMGRIKPRTSVACCSHSTSRLQTTASYTWRSVRFPWKTGRIGSGFPTTCPKH